MYLNGQTQHDFTQKQVQLKMKKFMKTELPFITRNAQVKIQNMKLKNNDMNKDVYLSRKKFQIDYKIIEDVKPIRTPVKFSKAMLMKEGLVRVEKKVPESKRGGFIQDQDVLSLLKLKEEIYPVYNYDQINKKMSEVSEADIKDDGLIALKILKD